MSQYEIRTGLFCCAIAFCFLFAVCGTKEFDAQCIVEAHDLKSETTYYFKADCISGETAGEEHLWVRKLHLPNGGSITLTGSDGISTTDPDDEGVYDEGHDGSKWQIKFVKGPFAKKLRR